MLGVDIIRNDRIEGAIKRFGERFTRRIYTQAELEYCNSQKARIQCLSARWACKEAVLKAFYIQFGYLLRFRDIEVTGNRGKPAKVNIKDKKALEILGDREIIISISHEKDHSVAVAIIR